VHSSCQAPTALFCCRARLNHSHQISACRWFGFRVKASSASNDRRYWTRTPTGPPVHRRPTAHLPRVVLAGAAVRLTLVVADGQGHPSGMSLERWMALAFALGSFCFVIGPFPGYAELVGGSADAITFFVGSVFFTVGGALQVWLAAPARHHPGAGEAGWRAAVIQSAGTLLFNVTTFRALDTMLSNPDYNRLVWRPDAIGSVCFLVSGAIAYRASERHGWLPLRGSRGWWEAGVNLLGCVFFGISAIAGYLVPSTGSLLDLAAANWNTSAGALCFLACAVATLRTGDTAKSPRFGRLRRLAQTVERDSAELGHDLEHHRSREQAG
jgi:hypothetical protein